MPEFHLNIVSFTIPFPANYGGVIDVFYKISSLKELGVKIHLHCFQYDREQAPELEQYCESVNYYYRYTGLVEQFSKTPYIVKGRRSPELLQNLLTNDYPIIFEGLHSCHYLDHPLLKDRLKIYRESNIEHDYYYFLYRSEKNWIDKLYFLIESKRLRKYQAILKHADLMLVVSQKDGDYLRQEFPGQKVIFLPSFHGNKKVRSIPGEGRYVLYHGNLSVSENIETLRFLVNEIFGEYDYPFTVAGLNPTDEVRELNEYDIFRLVENPSPEEMDELIQNAHVNIMLTFQPTGLKLKLLNTLYNGRFVIANKAMVEGTGLELLCFTGEKTNEIKKLLKTCFNRTFTKGMVEMREEILSEDYSDAKNARKLVDVIFKGRKK